MVVYTAITRDYDLLKEPPVGASAGSDFVAFLEEPADSAAWGWRPVHAGFRDPTRNAKIHKILPHVYFPDARYSLWMDGSVTIRSPEPVRRLVELYLADHDLVVFPHRLRTCIYQEAAVCVQRRLDDPATILRQVARYTREGYPANAGLVECPVILRRHTPAVKVFNEAWWYEIAHGSRRDQLSFQYVARSVGLRYATFPETISLSPTFHRGRHGVVPDQRPAARPDPPPPSPAPHARRRTAAASARRTIALGPVRARPSWSWVGFDTARELSRHYDVVIYDSSAAIPDCDVLLTIKSRVPEAVISRLHARGGKLVYCPIDTYQDHDQLARDANFLRSCSMILTHCERLSPLLAPFCDAVHFVEHHARFALAEMASYKEHGYVLWVGMCQYLPYLLRWLERHPLDAELRILTDIDNEAGRQAARALAAQIGQPFAVERDTTSIAGHRLHRWSERRQEEMMRECKAALDVKLTEVFNQWHKPPTKVQQFVASGVPVAVNAESYSAEYFRSRGFELASPLDPARWLSREYWEATRAQGETVRRATSLRTVGARYRELIESLWLPHGPTVAAPRKRPTLSHARDPR